MSEQEERQRFVDAALSWVGTPYHHRGRLKKVGIDCATLIAEAAQEAGLIPRVEIGQYSTQWNLNNTDETYLAVIKKYMHEIEGPPKPGDLVVWKFGRTFSHGAIVVEWPRIVHAIVGQKCLIDDASKSVWLRTSNEGDDKGKPRPRLYFSHWALNVKSV